MVMMKRLSKESLTQRLDEELMQKTISTEVMGACPACKCILDEERSDGKKVRVPKSLGQRLAQWSVEEALGGPLEDNGVQGGEFPAFPDESFLPRAGGGGTLKEVAGRSDKGELPSRAGLGPDPYHPDPEMPRLVSDSVSYTHLTLPTKA